MELLDRVIVDASGATRRQSGQPKTEQPVAEVSPPRAATTRPRTPPSGRVKLADHLRERRTHRDFAVVGVGVERSSAEAVPLCRR